MGSIAPDPVSLDIVERSIHFAQLVQFARRVRTETDCRHSANVARDFRWQTKRGDGGAIRKKLSLSAFPGSRFGKGGKLLTSTSSGITVFGELRYQDVTTQ